MDDDAWVALERQAAGPCPSCGSTEVKPVVYGMPQVADFMRLQGQVVFAGCCLPEVLHPYTCSTCRTSWGG